MEEAIQGALEGAKLMMKRVMFTEARVFTDIFKKARVLAKYDEVSGRRYHSWPLVEGGHCHLMRTCSVKWDAGNYIWLDVEPHDIVLANINNAMLMSKDYQLYFEIFVRKDNVAVVTVKYDRILGDRWVALIDQDTIPTGGELSTTDTSVMDTRPRTLPPAVTELIQTLRHRLGQKYGMPALLKPGKYIWLLSEAFVGRAVKVALPLQAGGFEHVWVKIDKTVKENGNQLAGKLLDQPCQATGFNAGDDVGLKVEEIEDVASPGGWSTGTSAGYDDVRGPDELHIFTRDLGLDVAWGDAHMAWFAMSDREKEWLHRIFTRRSENP